MVTWRVAALLCLGAATLPWWPQPWLGLIVVTGTVVALASVDVAMAAPLRDLALRRDGDRTCWLGGSATVTLRLRNGSRRQLRAQLRDAWPPSATARPGADPVVPSGPGPRAHASSSGPVPVAGVVWHVDLAPGETAALPAVLTPTRHGDRLAGPVGVRSFGPLRLAFRQHHQRPATPRWTLRVLPRFDSRRLLPEKVARLRVIDGMRAARGRGQGTEFDNLREYVVGDDVRSIDWRASARRTDLLVRTWRPERDRRVVVVLDTGRTAAVRIGDQTRLDVAIDAGLLLASLAHRAGDQVDLLAVDATVRAAVAGAGRQVLLPRLVDALAPLQPTLVETDFELVAGEVLRRERKRALVVLCTALEPGALGDGLLPVLPRLAARHQVVVAAVRDPALTDLTTTPVREIDDVYAAAAAWRTITERDRVAAALSRHGVLVMDAPAPAFASRLADIYLHLKLLGRL
ncbi:DUF58 domain-containing protein [Solwaraspora sp. WMMB335]|uniref:DUF58 domain-containing protein n=1 Tax=Solwaraspora sp. WMMB335 TaxID=3404118 RepID=UPI003B92C2F6